MGNLKISILDVGHGDFVFSTTPLGNNLVIDCGTGDVVPSVFLSKVQAIHELQISHPHTDHFDDILNIGKKKILSFRCPNLDNFTDEVIGWKKSDKLRITSLRRLQKSITPNNDTIKCDATFTHSVFSPNSINYNNPNTSSLVTILQYSSFKILLGGDLPDSGWSELLKDKGFRAAIDGVQVFKVPHHGRKEGCSEELFKYISPLLCIISDKPIDKSNENTVATAWYSARSKGASVKDLPDKRKVLSTRNDGSIFIDVASSGEWSVFRNTRWRNE